MEIKKIVSTRFYVENEGIRNNSGKSLEQAYVQLKVDDELIETYTIEEYVELNMEDLYDKAAEVADLDSLSDEIEFDPFTDNYLKRKRS